MSNFVMYVLGIVAQLSPARRAAFFRCLRNPPPIDDPDVAADIEALQAALLQTEAPS